MNVLQFTGDSRTHTHYLQQQQPLDWKGETGMKQPTWLAAAVVASPFGILSLSGALTCAVHIGGRYFVFFLFPLWLYPGVLSLSTHFPR